MDDQHDHILSLLQMLPYPTNWRWVVEQIEEYVRKLNATATRLSNVETTNAELTLQVSGLQTQVDTQTVLLGQFDEHNEKLKTRLRRTMHECDRANMHLHGMTQVARMTTTMDETGGVTAVLMKQMNLMDMHLVDAKEQNKRLREETRAAEAEARAMMNEKAFLDEEVRKMRDTLEGCLVKNNIVNRIVDTENRRATACETAVRETVLVADLARMETEEARGRMDTETEELSEWLSLAIQITVDVLQADNTTMQNEQAQRIDRLTKQIKNLHDDNVAIQNQVDAHKLSIKTVETHRDRLEGDLQKLNDENKNLQDNNTATSAQVAVLQDKLDTVSGLNEKFESLYNSQWKTLLETQLTIYHLGQQNTNTHKNLREYERLYSETYTKLMRQKMQTKQAQDAILVMQLGQSMATSPIVALVNEVNKLKVKGGGGKDIHSVSQVTGRIVMYIQEATGHSPPLTTMKQAIDAAIGHRGGSSKRQQPVVVHASDAVLTQGRVATSARPPPPFAVGAPPPPQKRPRLDVQSAI